MDQPGWHFWVDVGGTFTDCVARSPTGRIRTHKTLSSGVVKGTTTDTSERTTISDSSRAGDPAEFWNGWTVRTLSPDGAVAEQRSVLAFDDRTGRLTLDRPLERPLLVGQRYELDAQLDAPVVAIRYLLGLGLNQPLPEMRVRLGTTRGTNALLTRTGADVAWITTRGFADLLKIGYQDRPDLFALDVRKPTALFSNVVEIGARVTADGTVLEPLDEVEARRRLVEVYESGIRSLAIGLLHSVAFPEHELALGRIAVEIGFPHVSLSHRIAPVRNLVARGDTTVANAYLNPVLTDYLARLQIALGKRATIRLMTSAGSLVGAEHFEGKDSILSGPAGGVVGFAGVANACGYDRAIGFDMGGTSTDVARFDGRFEYEYETKKAGIRVVAPMLAIETVAAGGGSICHFDGVKLSVGPDSAGADPGPACYGRGGPLTVTDLNVFLQRVPADAFPFALDVGAIAERIDAMRVEVSDRLGRQFAARELAEGLLRIANNNMAQAIRSISIAKGCDPKDYVLVAFGGAAAQHACAVARELRIAEILIHPDASLLSAVGIGLANVARHQQRAVYRTLGEIQAQLPRLFEELESDAISDVVREGIPRNRIQVARRVEARYQGTDWAIPIPQPDDNNFAKAFASQHDKLYGYVHPDRPIEIVALHVEAHGESGWTLEPTTVDAKQAIVPSAHSHGAAAAHPSGSIRMRACDLSPGARVRGPVTVTQTNSTVVVDDDWSVEALSNGTLRLTDHAPVVTDQLATDFDPVTVEIFNGHFESIADQMGITLRNTASSVNVKERLDFSCAVFDSHGNLVANAPHIPVHLGAMGETVRCILADLPDLEPGDVVVTNDPFRGGSHLPDVTVVTPIFDPSGKQLRLVVASRAHHAEIGGTTPGSMPPFSTSLTEEGVLLERFKVVDRGQPRLSELRRRLRDATYPSRDIEANVADVTAQIAANQQGHRDLQRLEARYGWPVVEAFMRHIQAAAEAKVRLALSRMPDGRREFEDHLDEGFKIRAALTISGDSAKIDFNGTSPVVPNNLNANRAIVTAAVMYVLRSLINEPLPLNQGILAPLTLVIPPCMLNPDVSQLSGDRPAVAGGNVETSQRIVDVLLGCFELAAASQGTMNNLLFGNDRFGYYETICGGAGATPNACGADAVHTHMTNTRLTDPEVLEAKFPLRVVRFTIRGDSGGAGQYRGGNGVVRELEFLDSLDVTLLTQRRGEYAPYGLHGGQPGKIGVNAIRRQGQAAEQLGNRVQLRVTRGDVVIIETPGGGGYGVPTE